MDNTHTVTAGEDTIAASHATDNSASGILEVGQEYFEVWQRRYQHLGQLALSDVQLAAGSAIAMAALVLLAAALAFTAWLAVLATGWQWGVAAGIQPLWMGISAIVANVTAAFVVLRVALRLRRNLTLPFFRAALTESEQERAQ